MMRVPVLALALCAALPAEAKKVKFAWEPLSEGTRIEQQFQNDARLDAKLVVGGSETEGMTAKLVQVEDKAFFVQSAEDGDPRVVEISWQDHHISQSRSGRGIDDSQDDVHPVSGRTFTLDVSGDGLSIRPNAEGAMLEAIQTAGAQLSTVMALGEQLDGRALATGDTLDPRSMGQLVGSMVGSPPRSAELVLEGVEKADGRKLAVFDLVVEVGDVTGAGVGMKLEGKLRIEPRSGRLQSIEMRGPVHMTSDGFEDGVPVTTVMDGELTSSSTLVWTHE
ncbi:MAG: hypothetical protein R3F61_35940 [Myxococcota bacterium]